MRKSTRKHTAILAGGAAALLTLWGCASMGNPSGGPRDEDPPRFVRANPAPGSVNVDPSNINIDFNELVNVKDAFEKVVLSPPGKSAPRVTTRGRRIIVNITDTLLPNTTYTIDFGDAIEDNNEANKLSGFAYTFSTGPDLDSLRISGMVLGAEDMEPQQGVFVGAYIAKEDTAFTRMPFQRLARTDEYGRFVLRGLQDTTYRVFALKDLDNDRHYANPEEDIAWLDYLIRPRAERIQTHDTIRDLYTGAVDTVVERQRTRFLPNNVLLRMFNTNLRPQYLVSYTRPDSTRLEFILNAPGERPPLVTVADDERFSSPLKAERSVGNDTLTFWLPRELAMRDTLRLALQYRSTELSTGIESVVNDTVKLMKPKEKAKDKKKDKKKKKKKKKDKGKDDAGGGTTEVLTAEADSIARLAADSISPALKDAAGVSDADGAEEDDEEEKVPVPTFAFQAKGPETDLTQPLRIEVPVPLAMLDTLAFRLEENPDSVWGRVKKPYRLQVADSLSERRFMIEYPWERGMAYRLTADSLAGKDIYGVDSQKLEYEFKTKPVEELSNLKVTLTGLDEGIPAFVQLIASADKPKYTAPVKDGVAVFNGIDPGKYYARIYEDFNGDGKYTTGSYRLQRVFGTPLPPDSLDVAERVAVPDAESADSIAAVAADSIAVSAVTLPADSTAVSAGRIPAEPADSIAVAAADSLSISKPAAERLPLTDREATERLRRMGYSLVPVETDTVGTDMLIAIQPDLVYYYPKTINVKKNWDIEQTWNVFETALDLQKPSKLKKNKPKRTGNRQEEQEEEEEDDDDMFGTNPFDPNARRERERQRQLRGF